MVALYPQSSHLSSTTGWQAEDKMSHVLSYEEPFASRTPKETVTSYQSLGLSPTLPDFELDDPQNSTLSIKDSSDSTRKLCHNAYERDRRNKLNNLYSSLRALLPEMDQSKKLSIPSTVSRFLKYIPELQRQVEQLTRRKEEILLMVLRQEEHVHTSEGIVYPIVSATSLNDREVMLQICCLHEAVRVPLSKILRVLEGEGLQLIHASTSTTHDDKTFYSLHYLQAKESISIECQIFCEHLIKVIKEQARTGSIRWCV